MPTKYILVTGGVISGIGKGVIASSTGLLLKTLGLKVTSIKIDPYLNIDAGTLSPLDHGEVFVLDDGGEVDLDLGNYERFLDITLTRDNNITAGKIYSAVISRERKGDYLGKTVQVVPHITNEIQDWIERVAQIPVDDSGEIPDACIVELGGTVGDIESAPFIEAMRQFQFRVGTENFFNIHVSLIPVVGAVGEQKTKPTQNSVRDLRGLGISPDLIACRSSKPLGDGVAQKIAMFCHVPPDHVMSIHDCKSIYHVPILLEKQGLLKVLQKKMGVVAVGDKMGVNLWSKWRNLADRHNKLEESVKIALVGKYTDLSDSYISVVKALEHACLSCSRKLELHWVEASHLEESGKVEDPVKYQESWKSITQASGIIVPGGFGTRGTEGMILAVKYARENQIPFLGICLGLQIAVIEFARNVCGMSDATSAEFDAEAKTPVVVFMPEIDKSTMGGNMRLGSRPTIFGGSARDTVIKKLYNDAPFINERHRHRYEVNPKFVSLIESKGLQFVAKDENGERMIIIEKKDHPFFVATQFHPEYKTRPLKPTPVFLGFVLASAGLLDEYLVNLGKKSTLGRYDSTFIETTDELVDPMARLKLSKKNIHTTNNYPDIENVVDGVKEEQEEQWLGGPIVDKKGGAVVDKK
ncbi:CTP synthase ura7 [Nowakowskiella sp. JEL0407]|nr:CTP synthase ura7 [Nowakowskiella sp. JEL0407]